MYTDKERSIKLKELGFEAESHDFFFYCKSCDVKDPQRYTVVKPDDDTYHCEKCRSELMMIQVYSADTLFEWLREWANTADREHGFRICYDTVTILFSLIDGHIFKSDASLTNMLADAIIWILSQDGE